MLTELKFVQGAIARKDFIPALTHFAIEDGYVRGYNGVIALCSPIPFNLACKPKADPLIKAIASCGEEVVLSMTATGRLAVKSGKFKAYIDCIEGDTPHAKSEGEELQNFNGEELLAAVKACSPFIGDDASRTWTNGVLLLGSSAFATNNTMLIEYWCEGSYEKPLNIPRVAIKEMLRINEAPIKMQIAENAITLHYSGDRWLRTQLLATDWPDLARILNVESNATPIHSDFFTALETIKPFTDKMGRVIFKENGICTHTEETEGSTYDLQEFSAYGVYQIEMLNLLKETATTIDWSSYPKPCMFFGERLRGAIVGMKD